MAKAEVEVAKIQMTGVVSASKVDEAANFANVCATRDLIRVAHPSSPEFNLQPLFDELLTYLASCPPMSLSLPLLDLAEMGCAFPPGTDLAEKLEPQDEGAADQGDGAAIQGYYYYPYQASIDGGCYC